MLPLTPRMAAELAYHEAIVTEAYLDAVGVWTWGIGITAHSGHDPLLYKDAPADILTCLNAYVDLLVETYAPPVAHAFEGVAMAEHHWAAALSFHYNTGAIERASWVSHIRAGDEDAARDAIMDWTKQGIVRKRRARECALFFDGVWSGDGTAACFPVTKPDYQPDITWGARVDVLTPLANILRERGIWSD